MTRKFMPNNGLQLSILITVVSGKDAVRLAFTEFEAQWRKIYERKNAPSAAVTKDAKTETKSEPKPEAPASKPE